MTDESRRVTVNLKASDVERLDKIAERTGLSANEILRRALATQSFVLDELADGNRILVEDGDDHRVREVEFLY